MTLVLRSVSLVAMLLFSSLALAAETVSTQTTGYGDRPDNAVTQALLEAARQVAGVSITLDPRLRRTVQDLVITQHEQLTVLQGHTFSEPRLETATAGHIKRYTVLSLEQAAPQLWKATISAEVLQYKNKGQDRSALTSLVITPFDVRHSSYRLGEYQVDAGFVQLQLQRYLVNAFSQSGRFRVLDRDNGAAVQRENHIVRTHSTDPSQHIKRGQQLGADFILTGDIDDFSLGEAKQYYGATFSSLTPRVRIHYRLIETATREVRWADTFVWDITEAQLREQIREARIDLAQEPERVTDLIYPDIAQAVANEVIDTLYPVRVLGLAGGDQLYLSQGQGRLQPHAHYAVHSETATLTDPDTGLSIHVQSAPLATVEITTVLPDYAIGRVIEGAVASISPQAILRKQDAAKTQTRQVPPPRTSPGSSDAPVQW